MSDTIGVIYKYIDGAHFFVSTDKAAAGLCVANTNLETAFNEVATQLNALFEFNHGQKTSFYPPVSFAEFKKTVEASTAAVRGADQSGMIMPATIQSWAAEIGKQ
jgi:hypothetical protein